MTFTPPEPIPVHVLMAGYEQACKRFYAVMNDGDRDATFIPLFEALSWAVCIDERLQSIWKAAPTNQDEWWSDGFAHGDTVKGVRFARNRVHHQWADALWLSPSARPPRLDEWRWRPELPSGRNKQFEEEYRQNVAAVPARITLGEMSECFSDAAAVLAPWRAPTDS